MLAWPTERNSDQSASRISTTFYRRFPSTTKGRSFLDEYRRRCQPAETLGLLQFAVADRGDASATVRDQLQPERIADELRHISMTLDIAIEGATVDPKGDETARRFALCDRARRELATLAQSLAGELAPDPTRDQPSARTPSDAR